MSCRNTRSGRLLSPSTHPLAGAQPGHPWGHVGEGVVWEQREGPGMGWLTVRGSCRTGACGQKARVKAGRRQAMKAVLLDCVLQQTPQEGWCPQGSEELQLQGVVPKTFLLSRGPGSKVPASVSGRRQHPGLPEVPALPTLFRPAGVRGQSWEPMAWSFRPKRLHLPVCLPYPYG